MSHGPVAPPPPSPPPPPRWTRGRVAALAACIAFGVAIALVPPPAGVRADAWRLFALFAAVIASFILRPLGMAESVLCALVAAALTRTMDFKAVMAGYGDHTVWLVVAGFLLAGAVVDTGLGRRIALTIVVRLGRTTLGLAYALCAADFVLAPFVPSNTARGGGVLAPIMDALARVFGSRPDGTPEERRRAGEYLSLVGGNATVITSAAFLTAMAANPLAAKAAHDVLGVDVGWGTWALGAVVPALVSLALLPLVVWRLRPPGVRDAGDARARAAADLRALGPMTRDEKVLAAVFVALLALWSTTFLHGLDASLCAWMGVCALVVTGAEPWSKVVRNAGAWDAMIWVGGLVTLADALRERGLVAWFAARVATGVGGLGPLAALAGVALVYFYSMYGFSMLTGHIVAMAAAFMAVAAGAHAPPWVAAVLLCYFSDLCACLTPYSTGPMVIYSGLGYGRPRVWLGVGAVVSLVHVAVWMGLGPLWWKLLGWW
ncbi:MAG TPA: DASS family sodium-coupled anion symporter [Myxococcota bacterium]|nr:DASS family sodium-coupled anion symporter [Myxococcota bacterium]